MAEAIRPTSPHALTQGVRAAGASPAMLQRTTLRLLRHGATEANLAGLRCGGDLDVALCALGRDQAATAAERIAKMRPAVGLIVTSDLARTLETATIVAARLPGIEMLVRPEFRERRLGRWNLLSVATTQRALLAGETPPGGEPNDHFVARIESAMSGLVPLLPRHVLLVASKGVARVLGELMRRPQRLELGNAELLEFDLTIVPNLGIAGETA
jgi:broad specificity phosphatase PhoE